MSGSSKKDKEPAAKTKLRPKVPCYCKKCDGKLVDTKTRQRHEAEENRLQASISMMKIEIEAAHASKSSSDVDSSQIHDDDIVMDEPDQTESSESDEEFLTPKPVSIRKKRRRFDQF